MDQTKLLYQLQGVTHSFQTGMIKTWALRGLDLSIHERRLTCICGPSGSGKTTLLHLLALIEDKQEGKLLFHDCDLSTLKEAEKNKLRRYEIGLIFQQFHLLPVLTVEENIAYFLHRQGIATPARTARVEEALHLVDLWDHRKKRPCELSGGQQQRVAIARALAKQPRVIIADEPTASLDQTNAASIIDLLHRLCHEKGMSVVVASHDSMVQQKADQLWRICDGKASFVSQNRLPTHQGG